MESRPSRWPARDSARLWEDGETLVLRIAMIDRDFLMREDPETFFITDHYRNYPAVLARLGRLDRTQAAELIETAWRFVAPPRLKPVSPKT